ncbi:hypothetical protein ABZZ74_49905 [Streptomyces sp. NPDC006476]|uniref:hypothetical protein n=1 Tax=Streptomyces sp. NPDC006476 TaxID=3157175 RepID=UPI0033AE07AE
MREAHRLRELPQRNLTGDPWVQMTLASNMNNVVAELHHVLLNSDLADMAGKPEDVEWEAAMSMTLGKQGYPPPWPRAPRETAAWQSTETLAALSEHHRQLQTALIQTSEWRSRGGP